MSHMFANVCVCLQCHISVSPRTLVSFLECNEYITTSYIHTRIHTHIYTHIQCGVQYSSEAIMLVIHVYIHVYLL